MSAGQFHIEIDNTNGERWSKLITQFADASIYQTWSYGAVTRGTSNLSHIVLKRGDEIVGCCQVVIRRMPILNVGVADIKWGPLWRKTGTEFEVEAFVYLMREIKREYAVKRRYLLRMWPGVAGDWKERVKEILTNEGFESAPTTTPYRTLRLDLSLTLEDLRKNFLQKWRNHLNKAEKCGLTVVEGTTDKLYGIFLTLVAQVVKRKNFTPGVDYRQFGRINEELPEPLKMRVVVCESQGKPIAVAVCSAIGDTAIYILGATGDEGKGLNGAYLLQWRLIQWLKDHGIRWYDLGGIDPQNNPGVYEFKRGLAGKSGCEEEMLGEYLGNFVFQANVAKILLGGLKPIREKIRMLIPNARRNGKSRDASDDIGQPHSRTGPVCPEGVTDGSSGSYKR